jgi:hypothetical protein
LGKTKNEWTEPNEQAYDKLKKGFKGAQKEYYPNEKYKLYLKTKALSLGVRGIFYQVQKMENVLIELQNVKNGGGEANFSILNC